MSCVPQNWPLSQPRGRWGHPALARERAERPAHFAWALGQPDQDTLAGDVTWRVASAEVGRPSCGLDTWTEGTRASTRFQAFRPQILWFRRIAYRHVVFMPAYYTTGATR